MLSLKQIQRMLESGDHARLIDRVLRNGRCDDPDVAAPLRDASVAPGVARGLALQRTLELSYGPTPPGRRLAERLAASVSRMTTDDVTRPPFIMAAAVMVNALLDWLDLDVQHDPAASASTVRLDRAACHGLDLLTRAQEPDGSWAASVVATSVVVWQLGDHERFRQAVRFDTLLCWLHARADGAAPRALCRMAYAMAA